MKRSFFVLLLLLVATGCSEKATTDKPYAADDLGWVKRFDKWSGQYVASSQEIYPVWNRIWARGGDVRPLRNVLRPYRECAETLRRKVGSPEHDRLRRAYELMLGVCEKDRMWALDLVESFGSNQDQGVPDTLLGVESERLYEQAYNVIESGLLANRALPVRGGMSTASRIEPRLSKVAGKVAFHPIEVRCWSSREWGPMLREWNSYSGNDSDIAGFANGAKRANLAAEFCAVLARFAYQRWRPTTAEGLESAADALALLGHESEHLFNPIADEAEVECRAGQHVRRLAQLLGASRSYASRLAVSYWEDIYAFQPSEYRTRECRNDGLHDLRPETSVFP